MTNQPDISLVIPAYNRSDLLSRCLESLRTSGGITWGATVVDNASLEDLSEVKARFPEVRWIRCESNLGYAAANNLGLKDVGGRHVGFLNADAEVLPDTLSSLVAYLDEHPQVGAVTPRNVAPDWTFQPSCWIGHTLPMAWLQDSGFHLLFGNRRPFRTWSLLDVDWDREQEVNHSQATCLLVRRDAYEQVGEMDSRLFLFYNDVDYCLRLRRAGWKIVYLPEPRVIHHGSAAVQTAPWAERQLWRDRHRYCAKWYGFPATLGVRFAVFSRTMVQILRHLARGRFSMITTAARDGAALNRAIKDGRDGAL